MLGSTPTFVEFIPLFLSLSVNRTWSEPVMNGTPPTPRDSHTCTTVGENLFVFGGTDGRNPLNDLHILDTTSNTWVSPTLRGDGPEAREGHSAALIGKRLFIFGGCGKSDNSEVYYDDLYILNTETFLWKRVVPSGTPPTKRDSHTCSSWKNKIIVIGGEDSCDYYLSDVHILDADSLIWCKLNTTGQLLPPRAGHTTVAFDKNLFVFGGFSDEQNLYDDVYILNIETGVWTKVMATSEGPSARFSMAGECLDPQMGGVLVFIGGCNKNLEALDDIYFLHTGLVREIERDERRMEKLSLRKQLKLKCQEQHTLVPSYDKAVVPVPSFGAPGRQNVYLNEYQNPLGKRTFQAKVTKSFPDGYTIETIIDGKPLRGILFSNKPRSDKRADDSTNKTTELNRDVKQADGSPGNISTLPEPQTETVSAEMKNLTPSGAPVYQEITSASKPSVASDVNTESNGNNGATHSGFETPTQNASAAETSVTPPLS